MSQARLNGDMTERLAKRKFTRSFVETAARPFQKVIGVAEFVTPPPPHRVLTDVKGLRGHRLLLVVAPQRDSLGDFVKKLAECRG